MNRIVNKESFAEVNRTCLCNQYVIHKMHFVIQHLLNTSTAKRFGTEVPSSGSHYNKRVEANMPIYVLLFHIERTKISKC
jgi:hypothetical protein